MNETLEDRPGPRVAVVMPAYNAEAYLERSLGAALHSAKGRELLVVDPGSDDRSAELAESLGARVLRLGHRAGPAEARNAGVEAVNAEVVLFVDSDCVLHEDVVDRVQEAFEARPELVSLCGSYDDSPPFEGHASLYMNLRHHHTHHHAVPEPASFWAGLGAVRTDAFRAVGGFDAQRFPRPMIEDIELGLRLGDHGVCRLDPTLQATHLKRWSLRSVVLTDILCRAVPWTRLIKERGEMPNDLNLRTSQRIAAMVAPLALASIPALVLLAILAPAYLFVPLAFIALSVLLSAPLLGFFFRRRGLLFAASAWALHQLHLFYSAATFAIVSLTTKRPAEPAS